MENYTRHISDYHIKAGRLTMIQHGAYNLLIDACYRHERFPTELEALAWCGITLFVVDAKDENVEAVRFVLNRFFILQEDGTYVHEGIKEEIEKARVERHSASQSSSEG